MNWGGEEIKLQKPPNVFICERCVERSCVSEGAARSAVPGVCRARPCPAPDPNPERNSCATHAFHIIFPTAIGQLVKNPYILLSKLWGRFSQKVNLL